VSLGVLAERRKGINTIKKIPLKNINGMGWGEGGGVGGGGGTTKKGSGNKSVGER